MLFSAPTDKKGETQEKTQEHKTHGVALRLLAWAALLGGLAMLWFVLRYTWHLFCQARGSKSTMAGGCGCGAGAGGPGMGARLIG